jgi:hypothetical protein
MSEKQVNNGDSDARLKISLKSDGSSESLIGDVALIPKRMVNYREIVFFGFLDIKRIKKFRN